MADASAMNNLVNRFDPSLLERWRRAVGKQPPVCCNLDLACIDLMRTRDALRILAEEIAERSPHHLEAFQSWRRPDDKALWAMMQTPSAFFEALKWSRLQQLRGGRWWSCYTTTSYEHFRLGSVDIGRFAAALSGYFGQRLARGTQVRVERRAPVESDDQTIHLFTTVADSANGLIGDRQFELEFRWNAATGRLELCGELVKCESDVVNLFMRHILSLDTTSSPTTFRLDRLCDGSAALGSSGCVNVTAINVRWAQLRSLFDGAPNLRWDFPPETSLTQLINHAATAEHAAELVSIGLEWLILEPERGPVSLWADLALPNCYTLPDKPPHLAAIVTADLHRWGLLQ